MSTQTNEEALISMYAPAAASFHLAKLREMVARCEASYEVIDGLPDHADGEPYTPEEDAAYEEDMDAQSDLAYFVMAHIDKIRFSSNSDDWK